MILQGRPDFDQWVTKIKVLYTNDGVNWLWVDDQREFTANNDNNTKQSIVFSTPIQARTLRIVPTAWHNHISLRF